MQKNSYFVAPGKTVYIKIDGKDETFSERESIPENAPLTEAELKGLVQSGFLVRPDAPPRREARGKGGRPARSPRKWNRSPESLLGKTIDQLNVMIAEIDPKQPPVGDYEEAIELLTSQYDADVDTPKQITEQGGEWSGSPVALSSGAEAAPRSDGDPSIPSDELAEDSDDSTRE